MNQTFILSGKLKFTRPVNSSMDGNSLQQFPYVLQQEWVDPAGLLASEWRDVPVEDVVTVVADMGVAS